MFSYANGVAVAGRQTDSLELWQPKDALTGEKDEQTQKK